MRIDVWNSLHIVTNPDVKAGRRGSRLDICRFDLLHFFVVLCLSDRSTAQNGRGNAGRAGAYNTGGQGCIQEVACRLSYSIHCIYINNFFLIASTSFHSISRH